MSAGSHPSDFLLQHFDRLAEAPGGIPKLRALILRLAVQGKLAPQNPDDEPAAKLFERIHAARSHSDKKKQDAANVPEKSFVLPWNWIWATAASVFTTVSDQGKKIQTKDVLSVGRFPVVDQGKVLVRGFCNDADRVIHVSTPVVVFGDHTREVKLIDFDFVVGADGVKVLAPLLLEPRYFHLVLTWIPIESRGYGRHFKLLRESSFPLPPLAEQRRIVAKVEELMGLCDALEAAQRDREAVRTRLRTSALHQLASPDSDSKSAAFVFNHLPHFTTAPDDLADFRRSVLELAFQGRLGTQDPTDRPALKPGFPTSPDQGAHEVPAGWVWTTWEAILKGGKEAFKRGPFGSSLRKSDFVKSGYKVYEQYCPINDDCSFARYYITAEKFEAMKSFAVQAGDLLISCSGVTLGRITQVPEVFEAGVINQALLRVRINPAIVDSPYFKMMFRAPLFQRSIFANSTGSAIPNVKGVKELKSMLIPLPPLAEQRRIVAKVDELMAVLAALEAALTAARATAENLLAATVAGLQ